MGRRVLPASASTKQRKNIKPMSTSSVSASTSAPLSIPIRTPSTPDAPTSIKSSTLPLFVLTAATILTATPSPNNTRFPNSSNSISDYLHPNPSAYPSLASKPISNSPQSNARSFPTSSSIASRKEPLFPIPTSTSLASASIHIPQPLSSSSVSIPSASPASSTAPDTRISSNKCRISSTAAVADDALLFRCCYRLSVIKRSELNPARFYQLPARPCGGQRVVRMSVFSSLFLFSSFILCKVSCFLNIHSFLFHPFPLSPSPPFPYFFATVAFRTNVS